MRMVDLVFAFPPIILAMVVAAVLGRGLQNAALAIVVVAWPSYARVVRGLVLSVGDSEYVESARLLGSSARRTLFRDVLPNVAGPVVVLATLDLANAIRCLRPVIPRLGAQPRGQWGSRSQTAPSTSSGGGSARSRSRDSPPCSLSTR
jgi:peptide/nickel transport system permease protein